MVCVVASSLLLGSVVPRQASAALLLGLSTDGGNNFASSFNVQVGQTQILGVYLTDTDPGGVLEAAGQFSLAINANADSTPV